MAETFTVAVTFEPDNGMTKLEVIDALQDMLQGAMVYSFGKSAEIIAVDRRDT